MSTDTKPMKFLIVPRDAFEVLQRQFRTLQEGIDGASDACAESGQTFYVLEVKAIAARADRPVKVRKL